MRNRHFPSLFLTVLAVSILFSCTAEPPRQNINATDDSTSNVNRLTVIATFPEDTETKVTYQDNGTTLHPSWSKSNDYLIAVDDSDETYGYQVVDIDSNNDAILKLITSGEQAGSAKTDPADGTTLYFAYIPGMKPSDIKEKKVTVDISSQLQQNRMPAIMTASGKVSSGMLTLKFRHKCAVIGIKDITLSSAANKTITKLTLSSHEIVSGGTLNLKDSTLTCGSPSKFITSSLTPTPATDAQGKLSGGYFIAMIPCTTHAKYPLILTATDTEGNTYSKILKTTDKTWNGGTYYYLHSNSTLTKDDLPSAVLTTKSSVQWADRNLGATSPTDPGTYYMWGSVDKIYSSIYSNKVKLLVDSLGFVEKYTPYYSSGIWTKYYSSDNKFILDPVDDIVQLTYPGSGWQMPGISDISELLSDYPLTWKTGSPRSYYNGQLIFPASGYLSENERYNLENKDTDKICVWSSQRCSSNDVAYYLWGDDWDKPKDNTSSKRYYGYPIRPVRK